jgi:hypothetical protein
MADDFIKGNQVSDAAKGAAANGGTNAGAMQRMQESPGRALALAVVASLLCLLVLGLALFGLRQATTPLVVFAVVMGVAALMNWARFVYLRRQR